MELLLKHGASIQAVTEVIVSSIVLYYTEELLRSTLISFTCWLLLSTLHSSNVNSVPIWMMNITDESAHIVIMFIGIM